MPVMHAMSKQSLMSTNGLLLMQLPYGVKTEIGPELGPSGTRAMQVKGSIMLTDVAGVPLNCTDVMVSNPVPLIRTESPTAPEVGLK